MTTSSESSPEKQHDKVMPKGEWEFDEEVTANFDDMLERSIPQYSEMRRLVHVLAVRYAADRTDIVDLGASRGEAVAPLIDKFGVHNHFILVEVSEPMLEVLHRRFEGYEKTGVVSIKNTDLRREYPSVAASVTLCVLTLQFTPLEYRRRIMAEIFKSTLPGGVLILVEKVTGSTAAIDDMMVEEYLAMKRRNGYTEDEIQRKKMALEGVLVPLSAEWNKQMLCEAGFRQVDTFWRWLNFAGWLAIK